MTERAHRKRRMRRIKQRATEVSFTAACALAFAVVVWAFVTIIKHPY
jgi:hypothetical protein